MPQRKHVHCHPQDKSIGRYWVVEFEHTNTFKSPLMQWGTGSTDPYNSKGDYIQGRFTNAEEAINHAVSQGWGYDVEYPKFKYHTKKNYSDNFSYKGEPKEEVEYD